MANKTDVQLKAETDAVVKVNGNREITPVLDNGLRTNIIDSKVSRSGDETIAGVKTFSSSPIVPDATTDGQVVNKGQLDLAIDSVTFDDAGFVKLDGSRVQELVTVENAAYIINEDGTVSIQIGTGTGGNVIQVTGSLRVPAGSAANGFKSIAIGGEGTGVWRDTGYDGLKWLINNVNSVWMYAGGAEVKGNLSVDGTLTVGGDAIATEDYVDAAVAGVTVDTSGLLSKTTDKADDTIVQAGTNDTKWFSSLNLKNWWTAIRGAAASISGVWTFSSSPIVPDATTSGQAVNKGQLDLKAPLASPTFTGTVTVPTPTAGDNSTKAASTAYVDAADALKLDKINTASALTDASSMALTAAKHTLSTSSATRTFTISYTGDDITLEVTLSATTSTFTFPATALCVSEGVASGDNLLALSGVSGDKYIIAIKKIGSAYYVASKNFGQ